MPNSLQHNMLYGSVLCAEFRSALPNSSDLSVSTCPHTRGARNCLSIVLRGAEQCQCLITLIADCERTAKSYPTLGTAWIEPCQAAEVPLRQVITPTCVVVSPNSKPRQCILWVSTDQSMSQLEQLTFQIQSDQSSNVNIACSMTVGINSINGSTICKC